MARRENSAARIVNRHRELEAIFAGRALFS